MHLRFMELGNFFYYIEKKKKKKEDQSDKEIFQFEAYNLF